MFGKRNGQICDYTFIHMLWPVAWVNGRGLRRSMTIKLVTRKFGEKLWLQTSLNGQKYVKIYMFLLNTDHRVISVEEKFNNQLDRVIYSVDAY